MWLITPVGFFSVVRKPSDTKNRTLTVRARVRADLVALRAEYLPELGRIQESQVNDYRFRAVAPQTAVSRAMARLGDSIDYSNFKDEVATRQGYTRAHLYHEVWSTLYRLQRPEPGVDKETAPPDTSRTSGGLKNTAARVHPKPDDSGDPVVIERPSKPSPMAAWSHPDRTAAVAPDGRVPKTLHGVALKPWVSPPTSATEWETLAEASMIEVPAFKAPKGFAPAAGVVIREPDGRIWLVCPTNQFGGYEVTFPKGRLEGKSLQATAICEAYEESGLQVRLIRHLLDTRRTQTYTRYYLAERIGGSPADMGWESQCVLLVPPSQLGSLNLMVSDHEVLAALSR